MLRIGAALGLFVLPAAQKSEPRLAVIGDSTVAAYPGPAFPAVASFLKGVQSKTLAVPGHTITQQNAVWRGVKNKAEFDIIMIQVGLNDMSPDIAASQTVAELQNLVDDVNRGKRRSAVVAIAQVNPAFRRWEELYGVQANQVRAKWKALNEAIGGGGPSPITGVDFRIRKHVAVLSTPSGALRSEYDTLNDGIHPSASGRRIVACAWADSLLAAGFSVTC